MSAIPPGYITIAQAAEIIGLDRSAILRAIRRTGQAAQRRGRPPLPGRQLDAGLGARNPWIVRATDARAYAAAAAQSPHGNGRGQAD